MEISRDPAAEDLGSAGKNWRRRLLKIPASPFEQRKKVASNYRLSLAVIALPNRTAE